MEITEYVKPELIILVPVLYLVGVALKKSKLADKFIPLVIGGISILLCGIWVFANSPISTGAEIATAIFTAITQGILIAGGSVYVNQIVKQAGKDE